MQDPAKLGGMLDENHALKKRWAERKEKAKFAHSAITQGPLPNYLYHFIPKPLILSESHILSKVELQTGTPA